MAVVPIALTDATPVPVLWDIPAEPQQLRSPIPKGLLVFGGSGAVTAKGAGDETNLSIALTLPSGLAYIPRNLMVSITSADLVIEFGLIGSCDIVTTIPGLGQNPRFNMICPGSNIAAAVLAQRLYVPDRGAIKPVMPESATVTFNFADMDAGATSAATARWYAEFYVFNPDQVDKWELNTPIPTINHTNY